MNLESAKLTHQINQNRELNSTDKSLQAKEKSNHCIFLKHNYTRPYEWCTVPLNAGNKLGSKQVGCEKGSRGLTTKQAPRGRQFHKDKSHQLS